MSIADSINLDTVLEENSPFVPSTEASYAVFLRKFCEFVGAESCDNNGLVEKEYYTDENIAKFVHHLSLKYQYGPSALKSGVAAIGSALLKHNLPSIFNAELLYPSTIRLIKHWRTHLRIHPHVPKKADSFSVDALVHILGISCNNHLELRDVAITVLTCFTAMRMEEVKSCRMRMISQVAHTTKQPRHLKFVLDRNKTDPDGTGPVSGRTYLLPCTCLSQLAASDKKTFAAALRKDPSVLCPEACPYRSVLCYINACPRQSISSPADVAGELFFGRALTSHAKIRTLTCNPLGINEMKKAVVNVNSLLPTELQVNRASGHTGRVTMATVSMNNGGDEISTAAATKHKDPKTLAGYAQKDAGLLMSAALTVASALPNRNAPDRVAGINVSDDMDIVMTQHSSHSESAKSDGRAVVVSTQERHTELTRTRHVVTSGPSSSTSSGASASSAALQPSQSSVSGRMPIGAVSSKRKPFQAFAELDDDEENNEVSDAPHRLTKRRDGNVYNINIMTGGNVLNF